VNTRAYIIFIFKNFFITYTDTDTVITTNEEISALLQARGENLF